MATTVGIVGAGLVGRAWSIVFARAGCKVRLFDQAEGAAEKAVDRIAGDLPALAALDLLGGFDPTQVLDRLSVAPSLEAAVAGADYVQENTPERVEVKQAVFAALDAAAPAHTLLASSTSGIVASAFTENLAGRARCLVAHPLNPPHLIPLVELVPAPWTATETVERAREILTDAGQSPVTLFREVPGFIVNRLQGALLHEAFKLVADGVTDVAGVDTAMAEGLGLRWSFMGPFETIDLNAPGGVADYIDRFGPLYWNLAKDSGPPRRWDAELSAQVDRARRAVLPDSGLGDRQRWRDGRLMQLAAHKRSATD